MLNGNFAALLLRVVRIIVQIGILTIFYYMGVGIVTYLHIPLPGSVIGLLLLVLFNWRFNAVFHTSNSGRY